MILSGIRKNIQEGIYNITMELFVFLFFICTLFFVKLLLPKKEKTTLIDWSENYNDSCTNFSLKSRVDQYIFCHKVTEKDCPIENGIHGYDLRESYKDSYQSYSYRKLILMLRQSFGLECIVKYFAEYELTISHEKYKIDAYNNKILEVKERLASDEKMNSHRCFHLMVLNQSWHQ